MLNAVIKTNEPKAVLKNVAVPREHFTSDLQESMDCLDNELL